MRTCSLQCVKDHKTKYECTGKRKKTDFVPLKDFRDKHMSSDITLLEEVSRKIKVVSDGRNDISPLVDPFGLGSLKCSRDILWKLKKAASLRNITLELAPFLSTRRKANSTYCNCRTAKQVGKHTKMFWHIQWMFQNQVYNQLAVPETSLMDELIKTLASFSDIAHHESCDKELVLFRASVRETLEKCHKTVDDLCVLMKAEHIVKPNTVYKMDLGKTLLENLMEKTVVEHPIFIVCFEEDTVSYDILPNNVKHS